MSEPIERVIGKGHGKESLEPDLGKIRPAGEGGGEARGLEVPAQQRSDEVGGAEEVEGAGERDAGKAVQAGHDPGNLWFVDGEVRGDGPVAALGGEDGMFFALGDGGCGCMARLLGVRGGDGEGRGGELGGLLFEDGGVG